MDDTTKAMLGSVIRALIIAIGGGLYFTQDQVTAISGAAAILVGVAWSLIQKKNAGDKLQAAKDLRQ